MSGKAAPSLSKTPENADPIAATREELEVMRGQLAGDMENKKTEFQRHREETLGHLNAMSDRTIEIARMGGKDVEESLARDRREMEAEFAVWQEGFQERLCDEKFLDALAQDAFHRLLPLLGGAFDDSRDVPDTLGNRGDGA
jgi:hypothetical protein